MLTKTTRKKMIQSKIKYYINPAIKLILRNGTEKANGYLVLMNGLAIADLEDDTTWYKMSDDGTYSTYRKGHELYATVN